MGGGKGGGGGDQAITVGHRYFVGIHMGICHGPVDAVRAIRTGDYLAWSGNVTASGSIYINKPELYGGESKEGGIQGTVDFAFGESTQEPNEYLWELLGSNFPVPPEPEPEPDPVPPYDPYDPYDPFGVYLPPVEEPEPEPEPEPPPVPDIPAFRGVLCAILRQVYVGANPYIKPWSFLIRHYSHTAWQPALAWVGVGMNPAHIIYACLVSRGWGSGVPVADIDEDSFLDAAQTLYDEGFALSLKWERSTPIEDFIGVIKDHIDAEVYTSPHTGKYVFKLIRADYELEDLPVYGPSQISKVTSFVRRDLGEMINTVVIKYVVTDTVDGDVEHAITVHNIGLINQMGGEVVSSELNFPGICAHDMANKVAARELAKLSSEVGFIKFTANRSAAFLYPGDAFVLNYPDYGIVSEVMRVSEIDYGKLQDGEVGITAYSDVLALQDAIYEDPTDTGWTDPVYEPAAAPARFYAESTYWEWVRLVGESEIVWNEIDPLEAMVTAHVKSPSNDAIDYSLRARVGAADYANYGDGQFTPNGLITEAISYADTTVTLAGITAADLGQVTVGSYAYLGAEIVSIDDFDVETFEVTISRGILDTTPRIHPAGTRMWFSEGWVKRAGSFYSTEIVNLKVLPRTGKGSLSLESAPTDNLTMYHRMIRPYSPGKLEIGGEPYPDYILEDLEVTWAHRDRIEQTAYLVTQDEEDIGPEAGTTYRLRIYDHESQTLLRTYSGISGTSQTYPWETEVSDLGLGRVSKMLRVILDSVRDGYYSWMPHDVFVERRAELLYDGNTNTGGTAPVDEDSPYEVTAEATVLGPGDLEKTGYWFEKWNTGSSGEGTDYDPDDSITMNFPTTLYAMWALNFVMTYYGNGNTGGTAPTDFNTYPKDATVTVLDEGTLVKDGYSFDGWNTESGGGGDSYDPEDTFAIIADTDLYAQWVFDYYFVLYNGNGNTGGDPPTDANEYDPDEEVTVLGQNTLVRTGHTFDGWNTQADGGGIGHNETDTFNINANVILYAQWLIALTGGSQWVAWNLNYADPLYDESKSVLSNKLFVTED